MHRIYSGPGKYKRGYYRCTGKGPNRKGCGAPMVLCSELDEFFTDLFSKDTRPYTVPVYHPAEDNTTDLAAITKEIARASAARDYVKLGELAVKAKELEDSPVKAGWTEERDTGMTRAEYFESCDVEGRRKFLAGWLILASKPDGVLKVTYRAKDKLPDTV
jgi:hypothetical protein